MTDVPNSERRNASLTTYSLEITAKDIGSLRDAASAIEPGTIIAITFLPGESFDARVEAARVVRNLGFEPMPHFAARRLPSKTVFEDFLQALVGEAGVTRCFVIAGDPPRPDGPFGDSASLIATGAFERAGIKGVGVGGHPEGFAHLDEEQCWNLLKAKCADISRRAMEPSIVTQFGFDAASFLNWTRQLRARGIDAPVRLGVPGPAGVKTLMKFAVRCGVSASASVMTKYGLSVTRLLRSEAGPDRFVDTLLAEMEPDLGSVGLHFYPFGGLASTVEWISDYVGRNTSSELT